MENIRITKLENQLFIVEERVTKWTLFGLKHTWIPFIKTSGLNECWKHDRFDYTIDNILNEVRKRIYLKYHFLDGCDHYYPRKRNGTFMPCEFCGEEKIIK